MLVVASYVGWDMYAHSGPANLIVRSEPRGALVIVDGNATAERTPALLRNLEAGTPHKIRLELDGRYVEEVITIPGRGETKEVSLTIP